jgi:hypothetical protein
VYARHVDSSSLGFSLSSHRQSYIGLVFRSHFIDLIINKNHGLSQTNPVQEITQNVSSSEFTFTTIVTIIFSVFVPGRSRVVQKLKKWVCTTRDRAGTKTEIKIVTIIVKVNSEDDTFSAICCKMWYDYLRQTIFLRPSDSHTELFCDPRTINKKN